MSVPAVAGPTVPASTPASDGPAGAQARAGELAGHDAVRKIAAGVTVLTVVHGDRAHGSTASAVTAASSDPLLICVCLRDGSTFAGLAAQADRFVVNVLSGRQAAVADWFADPGRPSGYGQFAVVDWTLEPAFSAPLLGGAIAWLDCQLTRSYPAGDHSILLAEVRGGASGAGTPLLSFDRRLHGTELRSAPRRDRGGSTGAGIVTLD